MTGWLIVTPARNEAGNLPGLAASLAAQDDLTLIGLWVVVDDGSTDGTAGCVDWDALPFPVHVLRREGESGLARGGAFASWYAGADKGLRRLPDAVRVLKLDADVVLSPGYLAELDRAGAGIALVGGVVTDAREREHRHHVRGPLKAYDREAFAIARALPAAVGHDVMDEVAIRAAGLGVETIPSAEASLSRLTTSSEGLLRGRMRNGKVTKWTGYHPAYFALRLVRYSVRRPPVIGALAMLWGYLRAGRSPFPADLLAAHRLEQSQRLRELARNPVRYLRASLGVAR